MYQLIWMHCSFQVVVFGSYSQRGTKGIFHFVKKEGVRGFEGVAKQLG